MRPASLAKSVVTLLLGEGTRLAFALIGQLVIAAAIGPSNRGALGVLIAASAVLAVVASVGMNGSLVLYIGRGTWTPREASAMSLLWAGLSALLAFAVIRFVVHVPLIAEGVKGVSPLALTLGMLAVVLHMFGASVLKGAQRYGALSTLIALEAILNLFVFGALRILGLGGLNAAMAAWIASQSIPGTFVLIRETIRGEGRLQAPHDIRGAIAFGGKTASGNMVNMANLRLDVVVLNGITSAANVGYYSTATQMAEVPWTLSTAVGSVVFPSIASGVGSDGEWTARICAITTWASAIAGIAIAIFATAAVPVLMPAYVPALSAVWLLLPGTVALAAGRVLADDAYGRGLAGPHLIAASLSLVVTVIGNLLLVPRLGIAGAAIASSAAYSSYAAVMGVSFRRRCPIPVRRLLVPQSGDIRKLLGHVKTLVPRGRVADAG